MVSVQYDNMIYIIDESWHSRYCLLRMPMYNYIIYRAYVVMVYSVAGHWGTTKVLRSGMGRKAPILQSAILVSYNLVSSKQRLVMYMCILHSVWVHS